MATISIEEMQRDLAGSLHRVCKLGKRWLSCKRANRWRRSSPSPSNGNKPPRPFGLCAGAFTVPTDFDDPLPENVLSAFEGK